MESFCASTEQIQRSPGFPTVNCPSIRGFHPRKMMDLVICKQI